MQLAACGCAAHAAQPEHVDSNIEYVAGPGALYAVERRTNVIELLLAGYVVVRCVGLRQTLRDKPSPEAR